MWELLGIAAALAMDAFAASVCKGLAIQNAGYKHALLCGGYFGLFQALMPCAGFFLGFQFQHVMERIDHWIAFALLTLIGANLIREAMSKANPKEPDASVRIGSMLPLAFATSMDAFTVGITFAVMHMEQVLLPAVLLIGCTTFVLSAIGVKTGSVIGRKYKSCAEGFGGIVLILMGCRILAGDLGIW